MKQDRYVWLFQNGTTFQTSNWALSVNSGLMFLYQIKRGPVICKFIIKYK